MKNLLVKWNVNLCTKTFARSLKALLVKRQYRMWNFAVDFTLQTCRSKTDYLKRALLEISYKQIENFKPLIIVT